MPEKERQVNTKETHKEERGGAYTPYFLDLGTFEEPGEGAYKNSQEGKVNNPFKWKVIEEYDNFEDAYKGYRSYVQKQLSYDRRELEKIWANGRIDLRLRHGPKMLDWVGMYVRESDPESEDENIIKGKDPIESQEEKAKDSLSVNDSAFIQVFMLDSLDTEELESIINRHLKGTIYNSNIETTLGRVNIRNLYSQEFVFANGSSVVITSGLNKTKEDITRYANKAFRDINKELESVDGYKLRAKIETVSAKAVSGDRSSYSKFIIQFVVDGQKAGDVERSSAEIAPESGKYTDRIHEVDQVKKEALEVFSKYYGNFKEQARSELSKGIDLFNQAHDLYESGKGEGKEYNRLLDDAEGIFMRVAIVCSSTVEGYGKSEINTRHNGQQEADIRRAQSYAKRVRTGVNKENREMQKQAKEHITEEINAGKGSKGLMTNYETPKPKEKERSWGLFPAPAPDQRYRHYKKPQK